MQTVPFVGVKTRRVVITHHDITERHQAQQRNREQAELLDAVGAAIIAKGEVIAPGRFLPVAEQHGLATAIDRRVFDMALVHAAAGFRVAVNLSADSVSDPGLLRFVEDRLRVNAVDPRMVIFEITETALIHNEAVAQAFIEEVRGLNCAVALDDFGRPARS